MSFLCSLPLNNNSTSRLCQYLRVKIKLFRLDFFLLVFIGLVRIYTPPLQLKHMAHLHNPTLLFVYMTLLYPGIRDNMATMQSPYLHRFAISCTSFNIIYSKVVLENFWSNLIFLYRYYFLHLTLDLDFNSFDFSPSPN